MSSVFPGAGRLSAAVARVLDRAGETVGTGFVIGPGHIATCAHVVTAAVDPGADVMTAQVALDFPLLPGAPRIAARVRRWEPVRPDGRGDIAVLEMDGEVLGEIAPPPLWRADRPWGREFRSVGFPSELADGVWVWGEFRAPQGSGWLQLHGASGSQPITGGFSGSPVWDVGSEAVVGMAVAVDRRRLTRTAFMIPVNEVLGLDPALLPNPYRGLEPFGENDSHLFYGRAAEAERVLEALRDLSVVTIVGRSGIGKSSLVMAGVVPRLRADGVRIENLTADTGWVAPDLRPGEKALLVADQFEELVATDPERARIRLRDLLERAEDPAVRVLLTLRWDVMEALSGDDLGQALDRATISLSPMGREQLRRAIRGPATHAPGVDIDDDLVERLIDDTAGEPGGLPLLESVLTELWEQRDGGRLTVADYERVGRAAGSIARRAERVYGQFTDAADARAARRLLTELAAPRGDGFVRIPVSMRDVPELRAVAGRLARERLVATGRGADDADMVELAHQSLIDNWPRLREWLETDRDFLDWQRRTERARRKWVSQDNDDGGLLRGGELSDAEEWLARRPHDIPVPVRDYVSAGLRVRRREVRRWRVITAVLAVVTLVAAGTAVLAYRTGAQRAQALRELAGIVLAEQSLKLAGSQPNLALQYAQAAARLAPPGDHTVEAALLTQQIRMASAVSVRTGLGRDVRLVAADDTAAVVATGDIDGSVTVWPGLLDGGAEPWRLPVRDVVALELSGDGRKLATVDDLGGVQVWDVARRAGPFTIRPAAAVEPPTAISVRLSEDGARLVVSYDTHRSVRPVGHRFRPPTDQGDPDTVDTFDTTADPPARLTGYTTETRSDVFPLHIDSSTGDTWFHVVSASGEQLYQLRTADGRRVDLAPGDDARGVIVPCADGRLGDVVLRRPAGTTSIGKGTACLAVPEGATVNRDETGRYVILSFAPENTLFQLVHLVDLVTRQQYRVQARYQSIGKPGWIVRPGPSGPELFVIGADDVTRHAPAADYEASAGFGAAPKVMTWGRDSRFEAEYHSDTGRLEVREVYPKVRPPTAVTVRLPADGKVAELTITADNRFLVLAAVDSHELLVYSIPELRLVNRITLPLPVEYQNSAVKLPKISVITMRDDVIAAMHGGYITRWHAATGLADGAPQQIWRNRDEFAVVVEQAWAWENGTAPDELLIFTPREVTVWDSAAARPVRRISGADTGLIDGVNKTLDIPAVYIWNEKRRVEIWDTATGEITPSPVHIPWAPVVERTSTGLVIVGWDTGEIKIMDVAQGVLVDGMLPGADLRPWVARPGANGLIITSSGLFTLNLDRQHILARLCAISDREFTDAERELLPLGATSDPPCR
ncbi:trypsin-like peptidase domain-containing protein [Nocardia sp. NPDC127526]|uniref:nSTAND1 domain-containing NTPase n=1 Tax=Nocardia sp. NPDC127526 TaxID=3345393 RepID=UPI00362E01B0